MIYKLYFHKGDIRTDSIPTSEIESSVPDSVTDEAPAQPPVTDVDTSITMLDTYINSNQYLVVEIDTSVDELDVPQQEFVIDKVSGSVMGALLDRNVVFADYSQNIEESEYTPAVLTDSYAKSDAVLSLTEEQRDYILETYDVYDISTAVERDITNDYIVHAEKPIGIEIRSDKDITQIDIQKIRSRLPFDAEIYLTNQPSAPDVVTIKYDDSLSEYMHWFSGMGDRIDTQHELSVLINDIFSDKSQYEFNEMNEGSLIYKVREGGYERPW